MCLVCDNTIVNRKSSGCLQKNTLTMTTSALKITLKEKKTEKKRNHTSPNSHRVHAIECFVLNKLISMTY